MGDKLPQHVDRRHWVLSGIVAIAVILVWFHGVLGPVPDVVAAEQQLAPITTVYIVRHAERADDSANTPLSAAGRARAQELVHVLGNDDLDAVFVTNLTRTQQTGAPLAAARGIMAEQYPASDPQSVVNTILTDQLDAALLRGGENGVAPFFSPDGQWVGFAAFPGQRTLRRVATFGGPPETLTETPNPIRGAAWGTDDHIIFGTDGAGLFRVSEDGGEPEALTMLDAEQGEMSHTWPSIIPGHDAVVFVIGTGATLTTGQLAALDLDTEEVTRLGLAGVGPHYAPTGHLVYAAEDGALRAVPFDATSLRATGTPVALVDGVLVKATGAANYSLSDNGRLVYITGGVEGEVSRSLVWVDRDGREEPTAAPHRGYVYPRISPDGTRVAVDIQGEANNIWVWNIADETLTRLTSDTSMNLYGHWTPDGQRVVFSALGGRGDGLSSTPADGTGPVERLTEFRYGAVSAVTETHVIASTLTPDRGTDLIMVALDGDNPPETLLGTEFNEGHAALSPDGEWLAFESDESGRPEIHVRPFPDVEAGRATISTTGGQHPAWSRDGRELFYWADNQFMVASVQTTPSFSRGTPQVLFEGSYFQATGRTYDVAPDGRFLMIKAAAEAGENTPPQINVVINWFEELTRLVPTN